MLRIPVSLCPFRAGQVWEVMPDADYRANVFRQFRIRGVRDGKVRWELVHRHFQARTSIAGFMENLRFYRLVEG